MFYVIHTSYVGPNPSQNPDATWYSIQNEPGRTNSSHEERVDGWLGSYGDYSYHACGEYETEADAIAYIISECDGGVYREETNDEGETVYLPGKYEPWDRASTEAWTYDGIREDITADTTDDEIETLVNQYDESCKESEGGTLDTSWLYDAMKERRDDLREEVEEE